MTLQSLRFEIMCVADDDAYYHPVHSSSQNHSFLVFSLMDEIKVMQSMHKVLIYLNNTLCSKVVLTNVGEVS